MPSSRAKVRRLLKGSSKPKNAAQSLALLSIKEGLVPASVPNQTERTDKVPPGEDQQTLRAVFNIPSLVSKIIPSGEETPVGDAPVPSQTQPTELQFHSALRDRQAS